MPQIRDWTDRPWGSPWSRSESVQAAATSIDEIGLRRGMCYGPCPVYTLSLHRSGHAHLEGEHFVDLMGEHNGRIGGSAFSDLAHALAYLKVDDLERRYAVDYTDAQTTWTRIRRGRAVVEVEDYGGAGPRRLRRIEELIDAAAAEIDWEPVSRVPDADDRPLFAGLDVD